MLAAGNTFRSHVVFEAWVNLAEVRISAELWGIASADI